VDKVALGQVFSERIGFPLSVSFCQCSIFILLFATDAMYC